MQILYDKYMFWLQAFVDVGMKWASYIVAAGAIMGIVTGESPFNPCLCKAPNRNTLAALCSLVNPRGTWCNTATMLLTIVRRLCRVQQVERGQKCPL
jgi:hypothetical protein